MNRYMMMVMVMMRNCVSREKSYFLPPFENILISRCHGVMSILKKTSFMQNSHDTLKASSS